MLAVANAEGAYYRYMKRGLRGNVTELISLVVSTYNRPDALGAVLRSLARQSDRNFEIVIADDGWARQPAT